MPSNNTSTITNPQTAVKAVHEVKLPMLDYPIAVKEYR